MNADPERALLRLTPRGAPERLEQQVLGAVDRELAGDVRSRWERAAALLVAAAILLGVGLNHWAANANRDRMARLLGPVPVPRSIVEVVEAVESVTDAETGRRLQAQLRGALRSALAQSPSGVYSMGQTVSELEILEKERLSEDPQEDSEMDRDRRRGAYRHPADFERRLRHAIGLTA